MIEKKRIILVDDNVTNLRIGKEGLGKHFEVLTVASGKRLFQALQVYHPDLILLDIDMPEMDGFETIRRLKNGLTSKYIPVIFLSARDDWESRAKALHLGAVDYVMKPYIPMSLVKLIHQHLLLDEQHKKILYYDDQADKLVLEKTGSVLPLQNTLMDTLTSVVERKTELADLRSGGKLRSYMEALIEGMQHRDIYRQELDTWDDPSLIASAQLHDVGKIIIRERILHKPGKLTTEEFAVVRQHTVYGVKVIEEIERHAGQKEFFDQAKLFAGAHHERWDGSGYPLRLKEREIPLQGRMMAIVDVYDALVSERPYKRPLSHQEAQQIIVQSSGTQFDPALVGVFREVSDYFAEIRSRKIADGR